MHNGGHTMRLRNGGIIHDDHTSEDDLSDERHGFTERTGSTVSEIIKSASDPEDRAADSYSEYASFGPHWSSKRHLTCGNPSPKQIDPASMSSWRSKDRLKTSNAALVVCLNIDVDPPDIVKTNPCSVLECWVDPHSLPSNKALEAIGNNLHHQFEGVSARSKYKPYLDPSYEDTAKFCVSLRKMARDERCLFYYNGHGVPKPTPSGELWVFNKSYSQYIPVSLQELQAWLGSPCVYIWDCSAAGNLLTKFIEFAKDRDEKQVKNHGGYPDGKLPFMESIQLAACLAHEQLPMCPSLPADLFTSCLTSPIDMALRWYVMTNDAPEGVTIDSVQRLPGAIGDRRTPLGEMNWILTSITDTIAWTTFSKEIFTKLYRSDLLVASLFRNFLLAERIMKNYGCTPQTYPPLPTTNTHPLWATWDLAVDTCLRQLPALLGIDKHIIRREPYVYQPNRFFTDQLAAFEVWISRGGSALTKRGPGSLPPTAVLSNPDEGFNGPEDMRNSYDAHAKGLEHLVPRKPPEQLPIVLQLLLSQPHRLKALILLSQFVDLGPWAVHSALTIGIFPFILKLLTAPGPELRPVLIFIWARIMATDPGCQVDLYNAGVNNSGGFRYFATVLASSPEETANIPNPSEHRAMCCFILSAVCRGFPAGQNACWNAQVFDSCFERLEDDDFLLRQWMALCIGQMWDNNDDIKIYGVDRGTQDKLITLLADSSAEVRTAALFALGTLMGASGSRDESIRGGRGTGSMYHLDEITHRRLEVAVGVGAVVGSKDDASPMVRKELLILLSCLVKEWRGFFVVVAWLYWEEEKKRTEGAAYLQRQEEPTSQVVEDWLAGCMDDDIREENRVLLTSFYTIYVALLELSVDPYPEVKRSAQTIVDYVMAILLESPFTRLRASTLHGGPGSSPNYPTINEPRSRVSSLQSSSSRPPSAQAFRIPLTRSDSAASGISLASANMLRRAASYGFDSLKNLTSNYNFPTSASEESGLLSAGTRQRASSSDLSCPPSPNLDFNQYVSPYMYNGYGPADSSPGREEGPPSYSASDVFEALTSEDMERLKVRRRRKTQDRHHHHYNDPMPSPSGSTFSHDSNGSVGSVLLGLGTGAAFKDVLPLKSRYYDWCAEYFTETQMRQPESEEPGSVEYNEQMWRRQRNEQVISDALAQSDFAQRSPWDKPVATIPHVGHPLKIAFHSFDPHLFVANESSKISVYDWTRRRRITEFNNGNPTGTSITSLVCINQETGGIIMSGSSDGVVHLYRNYDQSNTSVPLQMVSSFYALKAPVYMKRGSGLNLAWSQTSGTIAAGGDSRVVRIWDANQETILSDMSTLSESPLTSLCYDPEQPYLLSATFADGSTKIMDRRLDEEDAIACTVKQHHSWIVSGRWQRSSRRDFVTASLDGEICIWDARSTLKPLVDVTLLRDGLSAFDVHDQTGVFAASSALTPSRYRHQITVVHSMHAPPPLQTQPLSRLNLPSGLHSAPGRNFPSNYIHSHTSLAFHPNEMILGIGAADGNIRLMGCNFTNQHVEPLVEDLSYSTRSVRSAFAFPRKVDESP